MNEKWFSLEISEIEQKLKTNAALGLSRKAARSRLKKDGKNTFFFLREKSIAECIRRVLFDPMLLLMIAVDIIAAVFGSVATAITCGAIIFINVITAIFTYIKSCRVAESMAEYSQPKVKVIRDGNLYYADSRALVRGDVILLEVGDILPADVRLISSNNLAVSYYEGSAEATDIVLEKNADAKYPNGIELQPDGCENMIHAGSYVVSGNARAIVVETDKYTYIGALDGGIPLNNTSGSLETLKKLRKISKIYGFVLMAAILPLTVIGIFTLGAENLLDTFMLVMAISVSALGELIYVIGGIIVSSGLTELALDSNDSAIVKNIESLGRIASPSYLFLLDDAAMTDGSYRVARIIIGDELFEGKDVFTDSAQSCAELIMMTEYAKELSPSIFSYKTNPIMDAISYYGKRIGIDKASFEIRVKNAAFYPADATHEADCASLLVFGERKSAFVSSSVGFIDRCNFIRTKSGDLALDRSVREELKAEIREMSLSGLSVLICASSEAAASGRPNENGVVLEGIIALVQNCSRNNENAKNSLGAAGIRTVSFVDGTDKLKILTTAGHLGANIKTEIAYASAIKGGAMAIVENIDNYRVFAGFSSSEIKEATEKLQAGGKTVAVAGYKTSALEIISIADVSISYGVSKYRTSGIDFTKLEVSEDVDGENTREGAQTLRCTADGLIERAGKKGGGLSAICNMIRVARGIHINLETALTYLICTQAARVIIAAIATLLSGIQLITPAQLLFGGLWVDLGASLACAFDTHGLREKPFTDYSLKNIFKAVRTPLIAVIIAAVVTSVAAIAVSIITKRDVSSSVFFGLTLLQIVAFFIIRYKKRVKILLSKMSVAVMGATLITSLLISFIPPIALVFGATVGSPLTLLIIPIAPVVFFTVCFLFYIKNPQNKA